MRFGLVDAVQRFGQRLVLDGATFAVEEGESVAISGPSGSGKSTLLAALAGFVPLESGTVLHPEGLDLTSISWISQSAPVLTKRSAVDNVALGGLSNGLGRNEARAEALRVMGDLGVLAIASSQAGAVSGGERQRLAVGRSMCRRSALILADEPTSSLDAESRDLVTNALLSAADAGAAVVIATHDEAVARAADSRLSLVLGKLVEAP